MILLTVRLTHIKLLLCLVLLSCRGRVPSSLVLSSEVVGIQCWLPRATRFNRRDTLTLFTELGDKVPEEEGAAEKEYTIDVECHFEAKYFVETRASKRAADKSYAEGRLEHTEKSLLAIRVPICDNGIDRGVSDRAGSSLHEA